MKNILSFVRKKSIKLNEHRIDFFIAISILIFMGICLGVCKVSAVASSEWLWPVPGFTNLSRGYSSSHLGIDIAGENIYGATIRASKSGQVTSSNSCSHYSSGNNRCNCNGGMGNYVIITHNDGSQTRYLHMIQGSAIANGTKVKQGDVIGKVGSSGDSSGPHLHFDMWVNGIRVNNNPSTIVYSDYGNELIISNANYPEKIIEGEDFNVEGTISAGSTIINVSIKCYDLNGKQVLYNGVNPKALSYDISKLNNGLAFNTLSPGQYKYEVSGYLVDAKTKILVSKNFVVAPRGTQSISDGAYHIVSALDNSYGLNVAYNSTDCGANIQLHNNVEDSNFTSVVDVKYLGNGYYKLIMRNSGRVLDVQNASTSNGANVWQYDDNGTSAQQWIIRDAGEGYFYIISKHSGLYMEVAGGYLCDYANIQMYTGNKSTAQKWKFIAWGANVGQTIEDGDYHIVSAVNNNFSVDVSNSSIDNNANIYLFQITSNSNQIFTVTYLGNGFYKLICKHSEKVIDVDGNGNKVGANVRQYTDTGQNNQQWIIKDAGNGYYNIISKCSGLYLDLKDGKDSNQQNIQVYLGNGTSAQKWAFIKERGNKIVFDMQGGYVDGPYTTYVANGINAPRNSGDLIIYNIFGQEINTNKYGVEGKIDSSGKVIEIRDYNSDAKMIVPSKGFIVSGHYMSGTTGYSFTSKLSLNDYVGYDDKTLKVSAYKDLDSYLIDNKYVDADASYGVLPIPKKEGYHFEGWYTSQTGGKKITSNNLYSTNKLFARWSENQKKDQTILGTEKYHKVYGDSKFYLDNVVSEGDGVLSYSSQNEQIVQVSAFGEVSIIGAGKTNIIISASETENYAMTEKIIEITVDKAKQEKFFINDISNKTYGDNGFILTTTGGSGDGEVYYSVPKNNGVLSIQMRVANIVGAGEVTITALKSGGKNYEDAVATTKVTVLQKSLDESMISEIPNQIFTGEELRPYIEVKDNDVILVENKDYKVSYKNNINISDTEKEKIPIAIVEGIGSYTGKVERSFNIISCLHTDGYYIKNAIEPSCICNGYTGDFYCVICNGKIAEGNVLEAIGHIWDEGEIIKQPTYLEEGQKVYICCNCGDSRFESIEKLGAAMDNNNNAEDMEDTVKVKTDQAIQKSVIKIQSVVFSALSNKIAAGKRIKLTANILPVNASDQRLIWSSSNPKVATVNQSGVVTMKKKTGGKSVIITARAADGSGATAAFRIKSMKGVVKKVTIAGAKKRTVKAGQKLKLKAKVAATKGANKKLIWTSSNTKYATVSASGKVKTKKLGRGKKVKITAMATDGSNKKMTVTIKLK